MDNMKTLHDILPLGIGPSLRWCVANWLLMWAGAIAPKESDYIKHLAKAARYASDRVKGNI
jgi:hypothetical protein